MTDSTNPSEKVTCIGIHHVAKVTTDVKNQVVIADVVTTETGETLQLLFTPDLAKRFGALVRDAGSALRDLAFE